MIEGKPRGNLPGSVCSSMCRGGAEVLSTSRQSPWVNLRRSLRVDAWNVRSLREDDHLSLLSSGIKRLIIGIAALSKVQRQIVVRSWWVVIPTLGRVALMVTIPKELL